MIDYEKLNFDILEEKIEFIDLNKIPLHLLTEELVQKFGSIFPILKLRIWFKETIENHEVIEIYQNYKAIRKGENLIEWNSDSKNVYCSYKFFWAPLNKTFGLEEEETCQFLETELESVLGFKPNRVL